MGREARIRQFPSAEARELVKLKRFAQAVRDEDHWQQILATTDKPEVVEELDRVVGPMLRHRRGCANRACDSLDVAAWQPTLVLRCSDDLAEAPIYAPLLIKVCGPCRDRIAFADVLTDDVWSGVVQKCVEAGQVVPDRGLTRIVWECGGVAQPGTVA